MGVEFKMEIQKHYAPLLEKYTRSDASDVIKNYRNNTKDGERELVSKKLSKAIRDIEKNAPDYAIEERIQDYLNGEGEKAGVPNLGEATLAELIYAQTVIVKSFGSPKKAGEFYRLEIESLLLD